MGYVEKRGPNRYRARYRTPDGQERSQTWARRVDAQRWLDKQVGDIARGQWVDPQQGRTLFKVVAEEWFEGRVLRPSSALNVRGRLDKHLIPKWGERPISSIRPTEVRTWAAGLSKTYKPATVRGITSLFSAIMATAADDLMIPANPARRLGITSGEHAMRLPTIEEVRAVQAAMLPRLRASVVVGAGLGLRLGEVLGLTQDRVQFLKRTVTVDRQLMSAPREVAQFTPPKTKASIRTVPLPTVVSDSLATHIAAFGVGEHGLLFTTDTGEPWRRQNFGHQWRKARTAAQLSDGFRFHDLRHFCASALIASGASVKAVQEWLGHGSAAMTLDVYSHLWLDDEARCREAIDAVFSTDPRPVRGLNAASQQESAGQST